MPPPKIGITAEDGIELFKKCPLIMECPTDLKKDAYTHTWIDRRANFSTLTADAGAGKTVSIDVKMACTILKSNMHFLGNTVNNC